ncbi:MAG: glycosyltransferase family 2 protein, partial [Polyangiales bacterium]
VGCVQARWGHMNREHSLLTRVQALMLDGHHLVDNRARWANNLLFNFSGTGGIWRVKAIEDAGGWEHDTLTEDLDLSYRAQMKGWKFVYRPDIVTPSELPEDMSAFRAQQFRWAKGTVQSARKLMSTVWVEQVAAPLAEDRGDVSPHAALHVAADVGALGALAADARDPPGHRHSLDVPHRSPARLLHDGLARRVLHARRVGPRPLAARRAATLARADGARHRHGAVGHQGRLRGPAIDGG